MHSTKAVSRSRAVTRTDVITLLVVFLIVSGLALPVLPALTAARESARRASCESNLNQIAKAFEIYLGQYGDYYPSGLGWWAVKPVPHDVRKKYPDWVHNGEMWSGDYSDRCGQVFSAINKETGKWERVAINWQGRPDYGAFSNAQYDPTCLGAATFGNMRFYTEAEVRARFPAGPNDRTSLKLAPVGMGWLLYTNALSDARSLYCPVAMDKSFRPSPYDKGQIGNCAPGDPKFPYSSWELGKHPRFDPKECNKYWNEVAKSGDATSAGDPFKSWGLAPVDDTLRSWYAAGGTDADTLVHGNWGKRAAVVGNCGYSVFSQYMYRNQPIGVTHSSDQNSWDGTNVWGYYDAVNEFTVCFTNPAVTTTPGCPAFKTPRQLGNHALVSDSWEKSTVVEKPGFCVQGDWHSDGYNVLYGNYATRWHADPKNKIMYWSGREGRLYEKDGYTNWYTPGLGTTVTLWMAGQRERWNSEVNAGMLGHYASLDPLVWHELDVAMDVDKNANINLYDQRNGEPDPAPPYSPKHPW